MTTLSAENIDTLDWSKGDGLIPAIVQDAHDGRVLMLGYMNQEALRLTLQQRRVTFFSRTKNRLWTKGETSNHFLDLVSASIDCDRDTLLIMAHPNGPTCHTGTDSCFGDDVKADTAAFAFLGKLEAILTQRLTDKPEGSYTAKLWSQGPARMAQKVGEEGVEVALAAVTQSDDKLIGEAADLVFHLSLLLKSRNLSLQSVVGELERRHEAKT